MWFMAEAIIALLSPSPRCSGRMASQWILPHRRYLKRDPGWRDAAHDAGLKIGVWTVDSSKWLAEFGRIGLDAVITNDPAKALGVYS